MLIKNVTEKRPSPTKKTKRKIGYAADDELSDDAAAPVGEMKKLCIDEDKMSD